MCCWAQIVTWEVAWDSVPKCRTYMHTYIHTCTHIHLHNDIRSTSNGSSVRGSGLQLLPFSACQPPRHRAFFCSICVSSHGAPCHCCNGCLLGCACAMVCACAGDQRRVLVSFRVWRAWISQKAASSNPFGKKIIHTSDAERWTSMWGHRPHLTVFVVYSCALTQQKHSYRQQENIWRGHQGLATDSK